MIDITKNTQLVKTIAQDLGFDECGIAKAEELTDDAKRLEKWLHNGRHGSMQYMENNFDLRINPAKLFPGAKTVITLLYNYFCAEKQNENAPKISKYAFGQDYHSVIKNKLHEFIFRLEEKIGKIEGRGFVDSAPVLERTWAKKSGLGWVGKNGNLINKKKGSFFFIATIISDLELQTDTNFNTDHCGTCTKCINHCPTEAILPNKEIDGSKCISYFTIELKDLIIPETHKRTFDNWMFGCDVCQDVCPWNKFSKPTTEKAFAPIPEILNLTTKDWKELDEENFKKIFKNSPLKRSKWQGIQRNINFLE